MHTLMHTHVCICKGLQCFYIRQGTRQEVKSFRKKCLLSFREGSHCDNWYCGVLVSSQRLSSDWEEVGVTKEGREYH